MTDVNACMNNASRSASGHLITCMVKDVNVMHKLQNA